MTPSETMISAGIAFAKFGHQHIVRAQFGTPLKRWSHPHRAAFLLFSVNEFTTSGDSDDSRSHNNFAQQILISKCLAYCGSDMHAGTKVAGSQVRFVLQ